MRLLVIFCFVSVCYSRDRWIFGAKAGVHFSNPYCSAAIPNTIIETYPTESFTIVAIVEYGISQLLQLRMEPMYIRKGIIIDKDPHLKDVTQIHRINVMVDYVDIPLLFKSQFKLWKIQPYVFAGPFVGFRLKGESETDKGEVVEIADVTQFYNSLDYGYHIGLGLGIDLTKNIGLDMDVRYNKSLTNIEQKDSGNVIKPSGFVIFIGVMFSMKWN